MFETQRYVEDFSQFLSRSQMLQVGSFNKQIKSLGTQKQLRRHVINKAT